MQALASSHRLMYLWDNRRFRVRRRPLAPAYGKLNTGEKTRKEAAIAMRQGATVHSDKIYLFSFVGDSLLKWTDPDEEGLVKFMCGDKQFNEERVRNGAKKLMKARGGSTQGRLDGFFTVKTTPNPKRKAEEDKKNAASKKAKTGGGRGRKPK